MFHLVLVSSLEMTNSGLNCFMQCICITCVEKMIRSTEVDKCPLCRKDVVEYA